MGFDYLTQVRCPEGLKDIGTLPIFGFVGGPDGDWVSYSLPRHSGKVPLVRVYWDEDFLVCSGDQGFLTEKGWRDAGQLADHRCYAIEPRGDPRNSSKLRESIAKWYSAEGLISQRLIWRGFPKLLMSWFCSEGLAEFKIVKKVQRLKATGHAWTLEVPTHGCFTLGNGVLVAEDLDK